MLGTVVICAGRPRGDGMDCGMYLCMFRTILYEARIVTRQMLAQSKQNHGFSLWIAENASPCMS